MEDTSIKQNLADYSPNESMTYSNIGIQFPWTIFNFTTIGYLQDQRRLKTFLCKTKHNHMTEYTVSRQSIR